MNAGDVVDNLDWMADALCVDSPVDFFSEDPTEVDKAKKVCFDCPVRRQCLEYALKNETRFGVWGGADEVELRKAQNIDQYGKPVLKEKPIRCPYCEGKSVTVLAQQRLTQILVCDDCNLKWQARVPSTLVKINKDDLDENK